MFEDYKCSLFVSTSKTRQTSENQVSSMSFLNPTRRGKTSRLGFKGKGFSNSFLF